MRSAVEGLKGLHLCEVLEMLEQGKVGHRDVMDWLHIDSERERVEIMHDNGRQMPGHPPMPIPKRALDLLRAITRPAAKPAKSKEAREPA